MKILVLVLVVPLGSRLGPPGPVEVPLTSCGIFLFWVLGRETFKGRHGVYIKNSDFLVWRLSITNLLFR